MSARPRSAGGTRAGWKREASSPSPVCFVLCRAFVYTALASLHRTNSPATRLQQPVAPRTNPRSRCGYVPAEGSRITVDSALSAIKRYVGGGACYHQFPRRILLGSSVNRGRPAHPFTFSVIAVIVKEWLTRGARRERKKK